MCPLVEHDVKLAVGQYGDYALSAPLTRAEEEQTDWDKEVSCSYLADGGNSFKAKLYKRGSVLLPEGLSVQSYIADSFFWDTIWDTFEVPKTVAYVVQFELIKLLRDTNMLEVKAIAFLLTREHVSKFRISMRDQFVEWCSKPPSKRFERPFSFKQLSVLRSILRSHRQEGCIIK